MTDETSDNNRIIELSDRYLRAYRIYSSWWWAMLVFIAGPAVFLLTTYFVSSSELDKRDDISPGHLSHDEFVSYTIGVLFGIAALAVLAWIAWDWCGGQIGNRQAIAEEITLLSFGRGTVTEVVKYGGEDGHYFIIAADGNHYELWPGLMTGPRCTSLLTWQFFTNGRDAYLATCRFKAGLLQEEQT